MMGLSCWQLRLHVVRPTLQKIGLWSMAAEAMVIATAAHESGGFQFIRQLGGGPGRGLWQIEPRTHEDLFVNFLRFHADLRSAALTLRASWPDPDAQLETNLAYQAAICRLIYYRFPEALPGPDDIAGQAKLWKKRFNTIAGKGTEEGFIASVKAHVR
jgi:hypothetical protein